jgi:hypothetical protein
MFYSCSNFLCLSLSVSFSVSFLAWLCRYHKRRFDGARPLVIYRLDQRSFLCVCVCVLRIATTSITRNDTWILRFFFVVGRPRHRPLSTVSLLSAGCYLAAPAAYKKSKPKRESTGIRQKNWDEIIICHAWKYYTRIDYWWSAYRSSINRLQRKKGERLI